MGTIQSNIGLITGLDITGTVDQLMQINGQQRDTLVSRSESTTNEQTAVSELAAAVVTFQVAVNALDKAEIYESKSASSSNPNALTPSITGEPAAGTYQITTIRQAQSHQLLSNGVSSLEESLGGGEFNFGFDGFIDEGVELSQLNGGKGVQLGQIRITDRSGESQTIDLRFAYTIDDVLAAINEANDIEVTATTVGDRIRLTDNTGKDLSNLRVQEVDAGSTASDLGLLGIDTSDDTALGSDVMGLSTNTSLSEINQGNGVSLRASLPDLDITLQDGTSLTVDFLAEAVADDFAEGVSTSASGINARVRIQAKTAGGEFDGVRLQFVNDDSVSQGGEVAEYDSESKTLTVRIDAGHSRSQDVAAAITGNSSTNALFTATAIDNGQGIVSVADTATTSGGAGQEAGAEATLGDILETINALAPSKLSATLDASGDRLILTDLTSGTETFQVSSSLDGEVAEDLGLTGTAVDGVISGEKLQSGLKSSLISSLGGGRGLINTDDGRLGKINVTNRLGVSGEIDLQSAETVDEVIDLINQSGLDLEARVNAAGNGVEIRDLSGGTGNLVIDDADTTETATALGIAVSTSANSVDSGSLHLQTIHENTKLSEVRGGLGISEGSFIITDSANDSAAVAITSNVETVGDLIEAINAKSVNVEARINVTGNGIELIDRAGGPNQLTVRDTEGGNVAAELGIAGQSESRDGEEVLVGSFDFSITLEDEDTLSDLVEKINSLGAPVTASVFADGSGTTPYRLSLRSSLSGKDGRILVDSESTSLKLDTITKAQDAAVKFGDFSGVVVTSRSNNFEDVIAGLSFQVGGSSGETVEITVSKSSSSFVAAVNLFVEQYNSLVATKDALAFYDEAEDTRGILFGSNEVLRVETELTNLLSGRFFGAGSIRSLEELGISLKDDGTLELDETKIRDTFNADSDALREFFTTEETGVAKKFDKALEQLAGGQNSLLVTRSNSLQSRIDQLESRIENWNERLDRQREALLKEFYNLETAIGKLQNNLTAIESITSVTV